MAAHTERVVADATEREIIEILASAARTDVAPERVGSRLLLGNGDDAAVFAASRPVAISTDTLVEGTHFRRDWSGAREIGARSIAQAASDIAAMGCETAFVVLALVLPLHMPVAEVAELAAGAAAEARRAGARIVGGDITSGPALTLTPTAVGSTPAGTATVALAGAQPGDTLALTGFPGRAAAGHALIEFGHTEGEAQDTFRVPAPPYALGPTAAAAGATALTDVTDGLLRDCEALAKASNAVVALDTAAFPDDPVLDRSAQLLGDPSGPRRWRLTGGEDHGLLATFAPGTALPEGFRAVGVIRKGTNHVPAGTVLIDDVAAPISGWDSARGADG